MRRLLSRLIFKSCRLLGPTWLSLAAARSDGQRWPKAIAKRLAVASHEHEHGGRLTLVKRRWQADVGQATHSENRRRQFEGSSLSGAKIARILVFGRSVRIGTMMQSYASAAKLRGSGPILHRGLEAMEGTSGHRHLGSSSAALSMGRQSGCHVVQSGHWSDRFRWHLVSPCPNCWFLTLDDPALMEAMSCACHPGDCSDIGRTVQRGQLAAEAKSFQ